jgi:hypothetical protein
VPDEILDFGAMKMVRGHAFGIDDPENKVAVSKAWIETHLRSFTAESADWLAIKPALDRLPRREASLRQRNWERADLRRALPERRVAQAEAKPLEVAAVSPVRAPGVVLDFIIVNSIPMPQGALSWWRAACNATDSIWTNHGTLLGSATYGAGKVGNAFDLNGTNSYVSAPDNDA